MSTYEEERDRAGRAAILRALTEAHGVRAKAAESLGVPARRLYREIERLGLWEEIDAAAVRLGWATVEGAFPRAS